MYDLKCDPALRDVMTFEEDGERYSMYYLQPRSQEDLRRRNRAHRKIADFCFGLMGRTPDAFAGNITGLSMKPEVFDSEPGGNATICSPSMSMCGATTCSPPMRSCRRRRRATRNTICRKGLPQPALRVTAEDDKGVTLNGMKMLASGAAYAHEVLVGNVMPLAPDQLKESITCVIPLNLPGPDAVVARAVQPAGDESVRPPLTTRFDESDCMLVFKDAKVPWEKVIVHDNPGLSRNIYIKTRGACDLEPSVERAVRREAALHARRREPGHALNRRARHPGGARDARPACRHGGRLQRHDRRADRGLPAVRQRLRAVQPALSLRRHPLGDGEPLAS